MYKYENVYLPTLVNLTLTYTLVSVQHNHLTKICQQVRCKYKYASE